MSRLKKFHWYLKIPCRTIQSILTLTEDVVELMEKENDISFNTILSVQLSITDLL